MSDNFLQDRQTKCFGYKKIFWRKDGKDGCEGSADE